MRQRRARAICPKMRARQLGGDSDDAAVAAVAAIEATLPSAAVTAKGVWLWLVPTSKFLSELQPALHPPFPSFPTPEISFRHDLFASAFCHTLRAGNSSSIRHGLGAALVARVSQRLPRTAAQRCQFVWIYPFARMEIKQTICQELTAEARGPATCHTEALKT